jgi:hypothetical protein
MWTTITAEHLRRVQAELTHRHFQMDIRHAEERDALEKRQRRELQELDARITSLEQLERQLDGFFKEYARMGSGGPEAENGKPEPREVEVVATWAKTKFGSFRAA